MGRTYSYPLEARKLEHGRGKLVERLGNARLEIAQALDAGGKVLVVGREVFESGSELGSIDVAKRQS